MNEKEKPLVQDLLVRTTARIECRGQGRTSIGTSFFFHVDAGGGKFAPILITNRHVVQNMVGARIGLSIEETAAAKKRETLIVDIGELQKSCFYHPQEEIDVAAIALAEVFGQLVAAGKKPDYVTLDEKDIATAEKLAEFSAIEEALMIGYPNGMWDSANNYPIVHKALTATPVYADYNNRPEFRLSTACYPGSSGSPIFLYSANGYTDRAGVSHVGARRVAFAGIACATHLHSVSGEIVKAPLLVADRLVAQSLIPNHVAVCIKATQLKPLLQLIRLAGNRSRAA
jgi:hypothetical protein